MTLHLVPVDFDTACRFVAMWHRHHQPPRGHKFSIGVAEGEKLVGVVMVGRPVARVYDDGFTLEVNRTATDGTRNCNSMLYAAAWRVASGLGYRRLTYRARCGRRYEWRYPVVCTTRTLLPRWVHVSPWLSSWLR